MAWLTGWTRRAMMTTQSSAIASDQNNFPVYVDLSRFGSDFWDLVKTDGGDLRITSSDGETLLPLEVVSIDVVGETGELHFKTNISGSSDVDSYIYWGNAGASQPAVTDAAGRNAVWSEYQAVWHFAVNPDTETMPDSSGNSHNMTGGSELTSGDQIAGHLGPGSATQFDASANSHYSGTPWSLGTTFTYTWIEKGSASIPSYAFVSARYWNTGLYIATGNNIVLTETSSYQGWSNSPARGTTWRHLSATAAGSGNSTTYRRNGAAFGSSGDIVSNVHAGYINTYDALVNQKQVDIDELRITASNKASDWIDTEHDFLFNNATVLVLGAAELVPPTVPGVEVRAPVERAHVRLPKSDRQK